MKNCIGGKNYSVSIAAKALQCYRNRMFFVFLRGSHAGRARYRKFICERIVTEKEY